MKKSVNGKFFLPLMGFISGLVNGLFGAGGGIVAVYSLEYILGDKLEDRRDLFANALCVMLPLSAVSCISYAVSGNLRFDGMGVYALPAIIGGIVGAFILGRIKTDSLKKLFAGLVIYSGIIMIIK